MTVNLEAIKLPPYIYGREAGENERVWTEASVRALVEEVEALRAGLARWKAALDPVMPADFKDWHENSPAELPGVAAWVITNLREQAGLDARRTAEHPAPAASTFVSLGNRGRIDLLEVESIHPRGDYPDEVTLVMRSGAKFSVSAQAAGGRAGADAASVWADRISRAKRAAPQGESNV